MAEAIGSVSSTKRKGKVLTIEAKLAILNSLSKGISQARLNFFFDDSAFQIVEHFAYPNTLWSQCVRI